MEPPRSLHQRKRDTLGRLESAPDAWIASADAKGDAYLVPLSVLWDGAGLIVCTPRSSVTGRNLSRGGRVRVGIVPDRVQAWREVNELPGRTLMRDGDWLP